MRNLICEWLFYLFCLFSWVHQLEAQTARNKVIVAIAASWPGSLGGVVPRRELSGYRGGNRSLTVEEIFESFSPSLLKRGQTKKQSNGVLENLRREMVEITERFIRTTRADHHRGPENKDLQLEAGYIYADCTSL